MNKTQFLLSEIPKKNHIKLIILKIPITLMGPCTGHLGTISTFCPDYTNSEMAPSLIGFWWRVIIASMVLQSKGVNPVLALVWFRCFPSCISRSLALPLVLKSLKMYIRSSCSWTLRIFFPSLKLCSLQWRLDSVARCICDEPEKASSTSYIHRRQSTDYFLKQNKFISLPTSNHVAWY